MSSPLVLQMLHRATKYAGYRGHSELARDCVGVAKRVIIEGIYCCHCRETKVMKEESGFQEKRCAI